MLLHQKKLIEQHFSFLKCSVKNNSLFCKGIISSNEYKYDYRVEIIYIHGKVPNVKIIEPDLIKPSAYIHMYENRSLCLHYPPDIKWHARIPLYSFTIPWLIEWIFYYELFLINGGTWEGPESPEHFTQIDKNIFDD